MNILYYITVFRIDFNKYTEVIHLNLSLEYYERFKQTQFKNQTNFSPYK